MNIEKFIEKENLKQTDALILKKRFLGMVEHYVIYMGYRGHTPVFVANFQDGVKEVPEKDIQNYLKTYEPKDIERFRGNDVERGQAFRRAISRIGEKAYNYLGNNCEHFKNWVHSGDNFSSQVNSAGKKAIVAGVGVGIVGLAKKHPKTALFGASLLLIGAGLRKLSNEK